MGDLKIQYSLQTEPFTSNLLQTWVRFMTQTYPIKKQNIRPEASVRSVLWQGGGTRGSLGCKDGLTGGRCGTVYRPRPPF
jgi:hypothetical protein